VATVRCPTTKTRTTRIITIMEENETWAIIIITTRCRQLALAG
jgi:hypothetical protein